MKLILDTSREFAAAAHRQDATDPLWSKFSVFAEGYNVCNLQTRTGDNSEVAFVINNEEHALALRKTLQSNGMMRQHINSVTTIPYVIA